MLNVFTDFHHAGLLNSFILLFEKRLGGNVYRPIGMEWAEKGYWKVYDHPATQQQFLAVGGATPDGTPKLNEPVGNIAVSSETGLWLCHDIEGNKYNKAITFKAFMDMNIDIVIASIPQHIEPFKKLCKEHPNKPKLIYQIGNAWTIEAGTAPNIMASALIHNVPEKINFISYHQEFDLDIFYPSFSITPFPPSTPGPKIFSFVNCFDTMDHFREDWKLFRQVEQELPYWIFRSFGGQCRDGSCDGTEALANMMREARFIWHTKNGGDGYGHVIHNSAAVARPLIVKKQYYQQKMAEPLLIDGETCIAIDNLTSEQIKEKIVFYSQPDRYEAMVRNVYRNFQKVVDFDSEFKNLQLFLDNLQ